MKLQDVNNLVTATVDTATYNYPARWWQFSRKRLWAIKRDSLIERNKQEGNTEYVVDNKKRTITFEIGE